MSPLVYLHTFALLLVALGAVTIFEPIVSKSTTFNRPLLISFACLAVPIVLLALLVFGLQVLLD
jgi:Na+-driven multidrug efflux pump